VTAITFPGTRGNIGARPATGSRRQWSTGNLQAVATVVHSAGRMLQVQVCIVGGGPAGMMLGYLLGRAGIETCVLEKHADFLRDFRGDTVHPSTMQIMHELGLLEPFLKLPHSEISSLSADIGPRNFKIADFRRAPAACRFIAFMPQWDFLNFLAEQGRRFPLLTLMMQTQVAALIEDAGQIVGVEANTPHGPLSVRAELVVGCDGRDSVVRQAAGLAVQDLGSPIDVLWFRLSRQPGDPEQVLGHLSRDKMLVTIDRNNYWQCAYVIGKGGMQRLQARGLEAFRRDIADGARFLSNRVGELSSFDDIKLLSVTVDRLRNWCRPGLLCIGDAAHAMSPVGGVGINLAIQDAVATANLLAVKLKSRTLEDRDLESVQRRRLWPVKVVQRFQVAVQDRVLRPAVSGTVTELKVPWILTLLDRSPWLRRWPAQMIGFGVRPEHVRSPGPV
jgi:2-polyprenyl-6-methoxyphenol hydroxylase-like FAD-dependent oxidoreductase